MLATNLTSNEVKDKSGTEKEFSRVKSRATGVTFALSGETYNLPCRLDVDHVETGTGLNRKRQSRVRLSKVGVSADGVSTAETIGNFSINIPVGKLNNQDDAKDVIAMITSFIATAGTNTFLYDGTGTGASALLNGTT